MPACFRRLVALATTAFAPILAAGAQCLLSHPLIKYRRHEVPPGLSPNASAAPSLALAAAANEYESIQVVCTGPLVVSGITTALPATTVRSVAHRAAYMNIDSSTLSDCDAAPGDWPDALIPDVDAWYGEPRAAFPATVASLNSLTFWVDLWVPRGHAAGTFNGTVTVVLAGAPSVALPFSLAVWPFDLPDVSPYATEFGMDMPWNVSDGNRTVVAQQYTEIGLMHRVTVSNAPLQDGSMGAADWAQFRADWARFVAGTATPFGLANASLTSVQLDAAQCGNFSSCGDAAAAAQEANWAATAAFFKGAWPGSERLLFDYTVDEPGADPTGQRWRELLLRGSAVHRADPALRVLCTADIVDAGLNNASRIIDLWVPIINFMEPKGPPGTCCDVLDNSRPAYASAGIAQASIWWYQSCMSHGCDGGCDIRGVCEMGWPSYMIDHSALRNRIHPWATYLYQIGGELYWSLSFAGSQPGMDGWATQYFAGGNGDGTLVYRGLPSRIGGASEVPVASVRLKHVRDGQEDLMLMALAEAAVGRRAVLDIVSSVIVNDFTFTDAPGDLLAARAALGAAVAAGQVAAAEQRMRSGGP